MAPHDPSGRKSNRIVTQRPLPEWPATLLKGGADLQIGPCQAGCDHRWALLIASFCRGSVQPGCLVDDTLASLSQLAPARAAFRASFDEATQALIEEQARLTRSVLLLTDAYLEISGRDPKAR
jgi:hypothetical protein